MKDQMTVFSKTGGDGSESTQIVTYGVATTTGGPDLPQATRDHCMARDEESGRIFVLGGKSGGTFTR